MRVRENRALPGVWGSYFHSTRVQSDRQPFWLALIGGIEASVALWLLASGAYPHSWPMYVGLALLVSGSVWDPSNARRAPRAGPRAACCD